VLKRKEITKLRQGVHAVDGAGVKLVRVLSHDSVKDFDPFLMLDSFDSKDPDDYTKGFPWHPHRGIETITYLIDGKIEHEDSLGNKGAIESGCCQWMTAASGILHQEMPKKSKSMLGFQLWLNMAQAQKMSEPHYFDISPENIGIVEKNFGKVKVLSGAFEGVLGAKTTPTILDIEINAKSHFQYEIKAGENAFVFLIKGNGYVNDTPIQEKTAVLFGAGDYIELHSEDETPMRVILFSGLPLNEPIAWGGPIVMNTNEELETAHVELREGNFIKHEPPEKPQ